MDFQWQLRGKVFYFPHHDEWVICVIPKCRLLLIRYKKGIIFMSLSQHFFPFSVSPKKKTFNSFREKLFYPLDLHSRLTTCVGYVGCWILNSIQTLPQWRWTHFESNEYFLSFLFQSHLIYKTWATCKQFIPWSCDFYELRAPTLNSHKMLLLCILLLSPNCHFRMWMCFWGLLYLSRWNFFFAVSRVLFAKFKESFCFYKSTQHAFYSIRNLLLQFVVVVWPFLSIVYTVISFV